MSKVFPEIDERLRAWIERQRMFFVGTAPSGEDGHLNVSPKGASDTLAVLGPLEVAYVDLFGSGIETVAHLKQNGRIVLMLCAFESSPRVVRLHGRGHVIERGEDGFDALLERFALAPEVRGAARSIVRVDVERVADSHGFVVPRMDYAGERDQLFRFAASVGPDAVRDYCERNNRESIDGLTALSPPA